MEKSIHTITIEDALTAINQHEIALAGFLGETSNKELKARIVMINNSIIIFYDILQNKENLESFTSLPVAIETYNNLP